MKFMTFVLTCVSILITLGCHSTPREQTQAPPSSVTAESYPTLVAQAKELADALGRKDYTRVIDLTYPKVIDLAGGRDKLLASMTKEVNDMEADGVEILSSSYSPPSQLLHDSGGIYAVVPVTTKVKARDGIFQTEGSLIGISTDAGQNWTFVDASGKDQTELKRILPNLDKLNLPPDKAPLKLTS